jgi:dTDP-4-dehydrorhamnose 3,5-epimerase
MKFIEQKIKGVFLIEPTPFKDERGIFRRHFCFKEYGENGIADTVKQANVSENNYAFTLRGFHAQKKPYTEHKIITVLNGKILNMTG